MIFKEMDIKGAYIIELEKNEDERGFFARSFCQKEFKEHGIDFNIAQCNVSYNNKKGTLRGMHYQSAPFEEAKLVSCIRGRIYDVIIDLRKNSNTYCKWLAIELSEENNKVLYVPKGLAHGFQTLENNSIVFYQMSEFFNPEYSQGIGWDDSLFSIIWPLDSRIISIKDKKLPSYRKNIL